MTRRHITFACAEDTLFGTLDDADGTIGLLIVTGGNETRAGAFSGQAAMAKHIAASGFPTFRFDRRGVGDSTGDNSGFTGSGDDIAAAIAAFHAEKPDLTRIVGFGNCDAASALMLGGGAACDTLILANPWTFEDEDEGPPPEAIRQRYLSKLKNPREILRLISGGVSLGKLVGGLKRALSPAPPPSSLALDMQKGLAKYSGTITYLLAANDRTAQAFIASCPETSADWQTCENAGHSFAEPHAKEWLFSQLGRTLNEQAR